MHSCSDLSHLRPFAVWQGGRAWQGGARGGRRGKGRGRGRKQGRGSRFGASGMCWPLPDMQTLQGPAAGAYVCPPPASNSLPPPSNNSTPQAAAAPAVAAPTAPSNANKAAAAALRAHIAPNPKVPTFNDTAVVPKQPSVTPIAAAVPDSAVTIANAQFQPARTPVSQPQRTGPHQDRQTTGQGRGQVTFAQPPKQPAIHSQAARQLKRHSIQQPQSHLRIPPKGVTQTHQRPQGRPYSPPHLNPAREHETQPQLGQHADFERHAATGQGHSSCKHNANYCQSNDSPPEYGNVYTIYSQHQDEQTLGHGPHSDGDFDLHSSFNRNFNRDANGPQSEYGYASGPSQNLDENAYAFGQEHIPDSTFYGPQSWSAAAFNPSHNHQQTEFEPSGFPEGLHISQFDQYTELTQHDTNCTTQSKSAATVPQKRKRSTQAPQQPSHRPFTKSATPSTPLTEYPKGVQTAGQDGAHRLDSAKPNAYVSIHTCQWLLLGRLPPTRFVTAYLYKD